MQPDDTFRTLPSDSPTGTLTRVRGPWMWVARIVWWVIVLGTVVLFIAAVPARIAQIQTLCTSLPCLPDTISAEGAAAMQAAGLSPNIYFFLLVALESLVPLIYFPVALLIYWRRSDDWMALFVSLTLFVFLIYGIPTIWALGASSALAGVVSDVGRTIGQISIFLLLFLFPNGRFVPRFIRWLALPYAIMLVVGAFSADVAYTPFIIAVQSIGLLSGGIAQIYRYRRISSPVERQQTKWAVFGFAIYVVLAVVTTTGFLSDPTLDPSHFMQSTVRQIVLHSILLIVLYPGAYQLPIMLSFAVLRSRLWDIDPILNRSMVYAGVTALLGAVFAGAFFGLRALLEAVLGDQQAVIAAVVSTGVVIVLFSPARKLLTRFVDRRLYGIQIDYHQPLRSGATIAAAPLTSSRELGPYTLLEVVGRGGMGEVYRASHRETEQQVAVKVLPTHLDDETSRQRFLREAQAMDRLDHPHIVALHEAGEADGAPYMVMDYVDGQSLSEVLRDQGRFSMEEVTHILGEVADALDYAHGMGIIHRDIKPSNVMIKRNGESHAFLMDFGIAKLSAATALTLSGLMGTLDYVSPEQIHGAANVDARADIYSMGVMAFQMLTGELPFRAGSVAATVMAHLMQPAPDPRDLVPDIPRESAKAVMQAMAKEADKRFESAGAFAQAVASAT